MKHLDDRTWRTPNRNRELEPESERQPKRVKRSSLEDPPASMSTVRGVTGNDVVCPWDDGHVDVANLVPDDEDAANCPNPMEDGAELGSEWEEHCAICLQPFLDRAILPTCAHEFCFECILLWAEQSRKCPLCNRPFDSSSRADSGGPYLIHHMRSKYDYQKYYLPPRPSSPSSSGLATEAVSGLGNRSHLQRTIRRRRERQWGSRRAPQEEERERADEQLEQAIAKRRWVYEWELYAKHVASNRHTRYRPFPTPSQFASSPDLISRMTMWLRRELRVWPNLDVEFLTMFTISLMKSIDIRSESAIKLLAEFLDMDKPYVEGARHTNAEHFAHEIYCYLRSPYRDLAMYDQMVQYDTPPNLLSPHHIEAGNRWTDDSLRYHSGRRHGSRSRSSSRSRGQPHARPRREHSISPHQDVRQCRHPSLESNRFREDERDDNRSASSSGGDPVLYSPSSAGLGSANISNSSCGLQAQGESHYRRDEVPVRTTDREKFRSPHTSTPAVHVDGSIDVSFLSSIPNLNTDPSIMDRRDVKGKRREIVLPTYPVAGETVDDEAREKGTQGTSLEKENTAPSKGSLPMMSSATARATDIIPADSSPHSTKEVEHTPTDNISAMTCAPAICNPPTSTNNTSAGEQEPCQIAAPIKCPSGELTDSCLSRGQRCTLRERVLAHLQPSTRRRDSPVQPLNKGSDGHHLQQGASNAVATMSRKRLVQEGDIKPLPSLLTRLSDSPPLGHLGVEEKNQQNHSHYASSSLSHPSELSKNGKLLAAAEPCVGDNAQAPAVIGPSKSLDVRPVLLRKLEEEQRQLLLNRPRSSASSSGRSFFRPLKS
ncbi:hypothetical protein EDC04DRAFT_2650628 [Pisolithus marmoratus]|nr:hypothetical protein EDC04DRAFT_2650628 [Pisolithus marmoratus]